MEVESRECERKCAHAGTAKEKCGNLSEFEILEKYKSKARTRETHRENERKRERKETQKYLSEKKEKRENYGYAKDTNCW